MILVRLLLPSTFIVSALCFQIVGDTFLNILETHKRDCPCNVRSHSYHIGTKLVQRASLQWFTHMARYLEAGLKTFGNNAQDNGSNMANL